MTATRCCLWLLLLGTCMALLLPEAWGAPLEPVYPGDDATPQQMAQYAAEMRRYINMLTRPRYGKSAEEDALGLPVWRQSHAAAPGGSHRHPPAGLPAAKGGTGVSGSPPKPWDCLPCRAHSLPSQS
ncbi:pancreatic polypeptide prohormone precursor [Cavia porcellus]|uniref:Pancreatic polypeptide prohormone n=1 Tax=Cavia porcellus TaxID=10141 RepID=PAHO_CAVPO|nr:pancreatic polypeptide prohormone precursor [Cavia porcellus]P13083.1 RecName: Full=Pancreatic polypeptide prohormone; Contains: RecName: Full=Pancreatic polypeptide; Short=PP; Contains: RecName: Full=Pancreatic icosapeptide-like; Flags: Precursor [Cavia porcellus]AAA37051.1 prepropancreatic polypeptide [Cavia porcellus]